MKNLLLTVILLCFCLPFVKAADQKMILISTNETDLILQVAPNGRLYQTYLGNKLVNESEFENLSWNIQAGTDGSVSTRGWEVYPCSGAEDYFEPGFRHPAQRREHDQYIQVCFQRIQETRQ